MCLFEKKNYKSISSLILKSPKRLHNSVSTSSNNVSAQLAPEVAGQARAFQNELFPFFILFAPVARKGLSH